MNRRLLLRVLTPAVILGLLVSAAAVLSIRYLGLLQANLAAVLSDNVASLEAAQELEIRVRQLRHHSMLYLMDPRPERLQPVEADQQHFEDALRVARKASHGPEETDLVHKIEGAYDQYQQEQAELRTAHALHTPEEFAKLSDTHPIRMVVDPCQDLLRLNKERMQRSAEESRRQSEQGAVLLLLLGLAGPLGGLAVGGGLVWGLKRSMYRLSVRVQDAAQRLDQEVGPVVVAADADGSQLDRQMEQVVARIEEAAERLRRHRRELDRAEQLSALGQLAAGVAHEVRNPLTGVKMLVEAALRPRNPQSLDAEDLRVIHREVARVEQTVQTFLDFARLPPPRRECCDLREVVAAARDLVRARADRQGVTVSVAAPDHPVEASVDRGQLGTVLVNLFLNALDAMPSGGRLDVTLGAGPDGEVRLSVADTGPGIAPEVADRLFTPFATTKPAGTGLGLSLSRRIAEEHGGSLTASNRHGGGACFSLSIPASSPEVIGADTAGR